MPSLFPCTRACNMRSLGLSCRVPTAVSETVAPETVLSAAGSISLKLASILIASTCARLRAVWSHRAANCSGSSGALRPGCNSCAVLSLKRK